MSYFANVCIDHATIYCREAERLNRLFSSLGFFSKNHIHYMTGNSYFELYQLQRPEESYSFFRSDAALHSFIFWSDDIDACYERVVDAGYKPAMPVSEFSRPADHGGLKGEAHFRGFYMQTELLPIGETAVVQQMSLGLIYPKTPYSHPNTVVGMDKMFLCIENENELRTVGDGLNDFCAVVSRGRPEHSCISVLEIGLREEFHEKYGVQVDPTRSCCTGIRFRVQDMDTAYDYINKSGLPYVEREGIVTVDATKSMNLFLQFVGD